MAIDQRGMSQHAVFNDPTPPTPFGTSTTARNRRASVYHDPLETSTPSRNPGWKWNSTPRRHSLLNNIQNLIPDSRAPQQWISIFHHLIQQQAGFSASSNTKLKIDATIRQWVSNTVGSPFAPDIDAASQIWGILCEAHGIDLHAIDNTDLLFISKNEFYVLCALLGQAINNEPVTLDAVESHLDRNHLLSPDFGGLLGTPTDSMSDEPPPPVPDVSHFEPENPTGGILSVRELPDDEIRTHSHSSPRRPHHFSNSGHLSSSSQSSPMQPQGNIYNDAGVWGAAPELHRGHSHGAVSATRPTAYHPPPPVMPPPMPVVLGGTSGPPLSASVMHSNSLLQYEDPSIDNQLSTPLPPAYDGWTPIENPFMRPPSPEQITAPPPPPPQQHQHTSIISPSINPGHFGPDGPQGDPSLPLIDSTYEEVTVMANPVMEGFFFWQHRNYQIRTAILRAKVVRRYSDFVWLLECLLKKFPFRQLPLLPPKRVAISGNYMTSDEKFVEKRRKGLSRFISALVKHPVLSREPIVVRFLTVPSELSVWRKQATNSLQEEFAGIILDPSVAEVVPTEQVIDSFRSSIRQSVEHYVSLCSLVERLGKRNDGISLDLHRFSRLLRSQTDVTPRAYHLRSSEVVGLNTGLMSVADQIEHAGKLLEDEGQDWNEGLLEDLKFHRDCLVSLSELFDRRSKLDHDNIPALEKRVQANEHKLAALKPLEQGKTLESEKFEEAILKDKMSISAQQNRHLLIRICLRDEIAHFQQSLFDVCRLHQKWASRRAMFADLQAENWKRMVEQAGQMPMMPL